MSFFWIVKKSNTWQGLALRARSGGYQKCDPQTVAYINRQTEKVYTEATLIVVPIELQDIAGQNSHSHILHLDSTILCLNI